MPNLTARRARESETISPKSVDESVFLSTLSNPPQKRQSPRKR
jgi:hypothetical protein